MQQLVSANLANQNISADLLILSHTATMNSDVLTMVYLDQIAGNGNYTLYANIQKAGAGSWYLVAPKIVSAVPNGITAAILQLPIFEVEVGDKIRIYVLGLGGDIATPDIRTELWYSDYGTTTDVTNILNNIANSAYARRSFGFGNW